MPEKRPPTDPEIHLHVDTPPAPPAKRRNGNVTLAAAVTVLIAAVGFFSTYVFVTKPELAVHSHPKSPAFHSLETEQRLTDAALKSLTEAVRDLKLEQRVTNENLNKLLRRSRITPASREDMRIVIESEDP